MLGRIRSGSIRPVDARRARALVGLALMGAFGLSAGPAWAILVRLPNGKEISYAAITGARAPKAAKRFDDVFSNLDYSGGPVMASNTNYTVVWQPSNDPGDTFQPGYVGGVDQFFMDLARDSGSSTNSDAVSTQYNDASGQSAAYVSSFGVTLLDTNPLPANGCQAAAICLTDAQIQSELASFLAAKGLPLDLAHVYFLLTPPNVASCFDASASQCSSNALLNGIFCAYHSASTTSPSFLYANIPDLVGVPGCDPFVGNGSCVGFTVCQYPNGPADGMLSVISHEHNETTTDPQPNNAWTDWGSVSSGGEIGDKCNGDAGTPGDGTVYVTNPDGSETPHNEVINGHDYWLQREWSNQTRQCLGSFTPNGSTASATFTQFAGGGNTVNFDAAGSTATGGVAEYVWQFNDGVLPQPQGNTVETTSPMVSHHFPRLASYTVALTVMGPDGTSNGTAHQVDTGPPPTAVFSSSPSPPLERAPVFFDSSGSADPNPGGSISSYIWNFGDGSASTAPNPTHTFATAGTYTVSLTVSDNFGLVSATVAHAVNVTDDLPTVAFKAPAGGSASSPLSFAAVGSDPDGALSYSWSFGDGGAGSGPSVSHQYSKKGTYDVTVTVADGRGHSAAVSHQVRIGVAKCLVPHLKGKALKAARKALGRAHCAAGKLKKPRRRPSHGPGRHKKWSLVVVRATPRGGSVKPIGTKVRLTLVWKAVRR